MITALEKILTYNPFILHIVPAMQVPFGSVPGFLPGAASLIEQVDKRLLIVLRDSKHVVGVLRSFDQFSNMVVEGAVERRFCWSKGVFADVPMGTYIVRGDNVVLLGEVIQHEPTEGLKQVSEVKLEEAMNALNDSERENEEKVKASWDFDLDLQG